MATATLMDEQAAPAASTAFDITVDRGELVRQIAAARAVVTNKITIPILGNLLLQASNGCLTITASDLDSTVQTACEAKVKEPGVCTVPARKFYDYVKLLPDGEVKITLKENHWIHVRSGRSSTKLVGLPAASFPKMPEVAPDPFMVGAESMQRLINLSAFAVSVEESRYTLAAALLVVHSDQLKMVATDGHRLAEVSHRVATPVDQTRKLTIPAKTIGLIKQLFADTAQPVAISENDQMIHFVCGTRTLISRKISGRFPNYEAVLPKTEGPGVVLDTEYVLPALERSMLFAEERANTLAISLSPDVMRIKAAAQDIGQSEEEIDIHGGPDEANSFQVRFNGLYLREAARLMQGAFTLFLKDARSPGMIEHATEDGYLFRYVIMPMFSAK